MEQLVSILKCFLERVEDDNRIGPAHISLFLALWLQPDENSMIMINRKSLMSICKIQSPTTYHKTLRQLHEFGYIRYEPTDNRWEHGRAVLKIICFPEKNSSINGQ